MVTGSFPGVKRPERVADHPPPSKCRGQERVGLYLYSPSGPSWPVMGAPLCTHKELIDFQNFFGVLTRFCHGKVSKTFLISNVSVHKTTLCLGEHVARELRVGAALLDSYSNLCSIDIGLVPQYRHASRTQTKTNPRTSSRRTNSCSPSPSTAPY